MSRLIYFWLWCGLGWMLLSGCTAQESITPVPTVDAQQHILFYNGNVLTMDPDTPQVTALAATGEKIERVGRDAEILTLERPESILIDLHGATVMPGFVDAHSHLFNDAEQYFDMSLSEVQQLALENGITALGDLYVNEGFLREIQEFDERGGLQIRTSLYLVATDNCGRLQGDWWREHPPTRRPGEMLRIGGVKIFTDGGTCKSPALSYELTKGEDTGDLFFEQEELDALVAEVHATGRQVAIHAIGDRAVEQVQNAIAVALDGEPNRYRHRIEHNSVVRPELLPRYGELGIVPVVFGLYPTCEPFGPPPPEAYRLWEWPWRALLDVNPRLPVAWHGDDPWLGRVRPLDDFYSFLTRNDISEDGTICRAPKWQRQHLITAEEALRMMTIHAAYALFRDDEIGSLEPGKYADLIVLSNNLMSVDPEKIPEIEVWMTMVGGRAAYCAAGREDLCP